MTIKIREKLLIPVILTIAVGMLSGFFYSYLSSTRAIEESIRNALERETLNTADLIDKWLGARHTDLLTWSMAPVFAEAMVETGYYGKSAINGANTLLQTLEKGYPYYDFLFIADPDGFLIANSHRSTPKKYRVNDRDYFKASIQGKPWISDIIISKESGKKVFGVSVPLKKDDRIIGVLAGAVNVSDFAAFFIHDFKLDQKGFAYMAEKDGRVIAMSDHGITLPRIDTYAFGQEILASGKGSLVFHYEDRHLISAYDTLKTKNWVFVVTQSLDEAFAPVKKIGWYTLAAGLALLVIVGVVVTDIFRRVIYKRLDRMLEAIEMVENGQLDVRILGDDDNDEIGVLTKAFNNMTARLTTTLSSLQHEIQVRKKIEQTLAHHRDNLEIRVVERTSELLTLRNYLSDIINSMPSVIVGVTHEMKISQWNLKAEEITGVPEVRAVGSLFINQFPHLKGMADDMTRAIRDKELFYRGKVRQPGTGYEDITVYPLMDRDMKGAVIRIDDVTERVALEEAMIQSEKMMSVGGLAAGMAHEINNPLAGMIQNIQVLKNRMSRHMPKNIEVARELTLDPGLIHEYMERRGMFKLMDAAVKAGGRAAKIVDNMLSFSRKDPRAVSRVVLPELMDQALELAHNDYDLKKRFDFKKIKIIRHYHDQDVAVFGHPSMLQQVFFNLLKNGAQAMASYPSCSDPTFVISIKKHGKTVQIEISDNGPGMDKDIRRRIFEPFFTTKGIGKGTGLGLSVSYFIIAETHEGTIEAISEPSKGTAFVIQLPVSGNSGIS